MPEVNAFPTHRTPGIVRVKLKFGRQTSFSLLVRILSSDAGVPNLKK